MVKGVSLRRDFTKSCKCCRRQKLIGHSRKDIVGQKFGRLIVIEYSYTNINAYWLCKCECGNNVVVRGSHLRSGSVTSCGCSRREKATQRGLLRVGKNNPMYNKHHTEKSRYKISNAEKGEKNHNWQGGIACEPYCPVWLDKEFKKSILERDNYQCQNPDCRGRNNRLMGHHIDYNKKNCGLSNIITVCGSCNSRANKDRENWTKFYQEIMNKKYGYKYGENNE